MKKTAMQTRKTGKQFLRILNGEKTESVPFWMMRQAGRYLPEYRELRRKAGSFLKLAYTPEWAAEVTLQPIRRFGMDAAILFSDILVVPHALGQHLEFVEGEGPKLDPVRSKNDLSILTREKFHSHLQSVYEAVTQTRALLKNEGYDNTALIGFAGAPWTVACYMVNGGGSKDFIDVKCLAFQDPLFFESLIDLLTETTAEYLVRQIDAGAEAVKIFDSWAGLLDENSFRHWVIEPTQKIVNYIRGYYPDIPIIGFPRGAGVMSKNYAQETGVTAQALDQMIPAGWAAENLQPLLPVQGNLDPALLLAGGSAFEKSVAHILNTLGHGSFIFNLGHGIHKETPIAHVELLAKQIGDFKP